MSTSTNHTRDISLLIAMIGVALAANAQITPQQTTVANAATIASAGVADGAVRKANVRVRTAVDTELVHNKLRDAINNFQDKWRGKWRSAELRRHAPIDLISIRGYNLRSDGTLAGETPDDGDKKLQQAGAKRQDKDMEKERRDQSNLIGPTAVGDRERNILTLELRRYYSLLCYIGTPKESEIKDAVRRAFDGNFAVVTSTAAIKRKADYAKTRPPGPPPDPSKPSSFSNLTKPVVENGGVSAATPRQIVPQPNTGSVCPSWVPAESKTPPDEGESIDFALLVHDRPKIRAERANLLKVLDEAQKQNPNDAWITGQRVRFAYDQRDTVGTTSAANDCRGDELRCLQLKGFALLQSEKLLESESTFRKAEAAERLVATRDSLCGNSETYMLLNHDDVDEIRKKSCAEQGALVDNMWWLADPLWSVPGNERYVAHNVRKLHTALRSVTDRDERYVWQDISGGQALREMVVRYGWPSYTYWPGGRLEEEMSKYREHGRLQNFYSAPPYTAKEYTPDRTALIPNGKALFDPFQLNDDAWKLYAPTKTMDDWWPQEHFFYPTHLGTLNTGQDIMWRRDTSITYQLTVDEPLQTLDPSSTENSKAVLMGGNSPSTTRQLTQTAIARGFTLRLLATLPSAPIVLSAEVLPRTVFERALRRRYAIHPPPTLREMKNGDVALSEPLLLRLPNHTMSVPVDQQDVLRYMAGDLSFIADEPLGLYWESYGFQPGDTIDVELKFRRTADLNAAQRLLGAVGIGGSRDSVSIKWREPDPRHAAVLMSGAKTIIGRAVAVDLSALEGGTYDVVLQMRKGAVTARSERRIVVKKRANSSGT